MKVVQIMFTSKEKIGKQSVEKRLLEERRVIVRIWHSQWNIHKKGVGVGHISIQAGDVYMSLWPKKPLEGSSAKQQKKGKHQHELLVDYEKDLVYEKRPPETTLCFYSLDRDAIVDAFRQIEEKLSGWTLLGNIAIKNAHSCASMAWDLLLRGNLGRLLSPRHQTSVQSQESTKGSGYGTGAFFASQSGDSKNGSIYSLQNFIQGTIKSPDAIRALLVEAKKVEWKKEPSTKKMTYEQETVKPKP